MMRALLVVLIACGNGPAKHSDAKVVDMMVDMRVPPPDAPPGYFYYVIDHEMVPTNNAQARAYGLDLNGDGTIDNQLGMVLGTLSTMGFDIQGNTTKAIDTGNVLMLADLYALDFTTTTSSTFTTFDGANPSPAPCSSPSDTVCRHHLTGSGIFDVASTSPRDTPLAGGAVNGTFNEGPGHMSIQFAMADSTTPLHLPLIGARARFSGASPTGIASGILAGAVTQNDVNTKLIPQMQMSFAPIVQRDCCGAPTSPSPTCNATANPPCGCIDGSTGKTLLGLFDTMPKDCMITASEIQNNSLIMSLLAPDVTVEGQMALSIGVGFTAVAGNYAP
jgi:hypothetical protein